MGLDGESTSGDARFFNRCGPFPLSEVVAAIGADIAPSGDLTRLMSGVAPLQAAGPGQVSFLDNRHYESWLASSRAGAIIVHPEMADRVPTGCVALVTREPYLAWARVARLFHPEPPTRPGMHPTAWANPAAHVDPSAEIGPFCVIGADAEIGPNCRLGAHVVIGDGVIVGADARIGAHCSISHAILSDRVTLSPGVRVGQEGFGFAPTASGFVTVPQLGRVLIEADVEIGANTTVDRGSGNDTVIGAGSRLDNLVQIGHNVRVGRCCVIVSQAGISGSTVIEDFVQIAGQAGIVGHLKIGRGAQIGGQCGVMADVSAGAKVVGSPAQPVRDYFRQMALLKRLAAKGAGERGAAAASATGETGSG